MKHTATKMLLAFLVIFGFSSKAINPGQASFVKLKISDPVEVKINGKSRTGIGMTIPMILEKETDKQTIYSDNELTIPTSSIPIILTPAKNLDSVLTMAFFHCDLIIR